MASKSISPFPIHLTSLLVIASKAGQQANTQQMDQQVKTWKKNPLIWFRKAGERIKEMEE